MLLGVLFGTPLLTPFKRTNTSFTSVSSETEVFSLLFGPRVLPLMSWQKHVSYIYLLSVSFIWVYGRLYFQV